MNHGHVKPNKDGSLARCGGPGLCAECSQELASMPPDNNVHTMPTHGPRHYESAKCWCEPELAADYSGKGGVKMYVHKELQ